MPRYAIGVTLTTEERAMMRPVGNSSATVKTHRFVVTLPDGIRCEVDYRRAGPAYHLFEFREPVHQTVWSGDRLDGSVAAVEQEGVRCAISAFQLAQEKEQREMKRANLPKGVKRVGALGDLTSKAAAQCGGKYAVCVKFGAEGLIRIGEIRERPEEAVRDLGLAKDKYSLKSDQEPVIGICNRVYRKWQLPRFLSLEKVPNKGD